MFDHVKFGVSDYAGSKAFILKAAKQVVEHGALTPDLHICPSLRRKRATGKLA